MASDQIHVIPKSGMVKDPYLRLYSNGEFIRSYRLSPGNTVVGRDPSASIMVSDRFVSRHHFFVEYDGKNGLDIQDLKSRNGTFVNGQKIDRLKLKHGDKISFGIFEMVLAYPRPTAGRDAAGLPTEPRIADTDATIPPITRPEVQIERPKRPTGFRPIAKLPPTREAEIEALPYRVIPRRTLTWTAKFLMVSGVTIFLSAFLAWNAYQWAKLREQRIAANANPDLVAAPETGGNTPNQAQQEKRVDPRTMANREVSPKQKNLKRDMIAGLDKSVKSILQDDKAGDHTQALQNNTPDKSSNKMAKVFDPVSPESISVQIKMPSTNAGLDEQSKQKIKNFDLNAYQSMLKERVYVVQDCFVEHMKDSPKPGKISVQLTVRQSGLVQKAGIESSSFHNKEFEKCIINNIQKIRVDPPPWDGFTVTYTFKFQGSKVDFG